MELVPDSRIDNETFVVEAAELIRKKMETIVDFVCDNWIAYAHIGPEHQAAIMFYTERMVIVNKAFSYFDVDCFDKAAAYLDELVSVKGE